MRFRDRQEAGRRLGQALQRYRAERPIVLALPRGGVPVAAEVAHALGAPVDVLVARKLGVPGWPELGMGAIAEGGAIFLDGETMRNLRVDPRDLEEVGEKEAAELARRARTYRGGRSLPPLEGRTVILVDDGVATGGTARAAIRAARGRDAGRVVLATPVIARGTADELRDEVDDLVWLEAPVDFESVGSWYDEFAQITDGEVVALLEEARASRPPTQPEADDPEEGTIPVGEPPRR